MGSVSRVARYGRSLDGLRLMSGAIGSVVWQPLLISKDAVASTKLCPIRARRERGIVRPELPVHDRPLRRGDRLRLQGLPIESWVLLCTHIVSRLAERESVHPARDISPRHVLLHSLDQRVLRRRVVRQRPGRLRPAVRVPSDPRRRPDRCPDSSCRERFLRCLQ
jgi:hypothetical protein